MRSHTKGLLGFAVGVLLITSVASAALVHKVYAEAPHCFQRSLVGDAAFQEIDCATKKDLLEGLGKGPVQDDKCYNFAELSVEEQPFTAAPPNDFCQQWLAAGNKTATTPASCVAIDGSMKDWQEHKVKDLSQLHPNQNCADYAERVKASGIPQNFKMGNCYLLFKESDTVYLSQQYECRVGLQALLANNQISNSPTGQGSINVTRNDAANCDGQNGKLEDCFKNHNPLVGRLNQVMNFLSAGVGIIVVVMVIIGGLQYTAAGNNPQAVSAAKKKISNALIAFVAFMLLYSFMQWLIPGGPF